MVYFVSDIPDLGRIMLVVATSNTCDAENASPYT